MHPLHEDVGDEGFMSGLGSEVGTKNLALEPLIIKQFVNSKVEALQVSDLDVKLHDDGVGPGEGDELPQGGADHGVPWHGPPQLRGHQLGGDEPGAALVGRVVSHGVQALHLVAEERKLGENIDTVIY